MDDPTSGYRVSQGVLVAPFAGSSVAVDLVSDTVHFLGRAGAWLMAQQSPVSIDALVVDTPESERGDQIRAIQAALEPLRDAGLIDREPARLATPTTSHREVCEVELQGGVVRLVDGRVIVVCGPTGSALADRLNARGGERLANRPKGDEVLIVRHDPSHRGMLTSRPLEPEAALRSVLDHVENLERAGASGLADVCRLVEAVPVVPFTYPDLDAAIQVILGI